MDSRLGGSDPHRHPPAGRVHSEKRVYCPVSVLVLMLVRLRINLCPLPNTRYLPPLSSSSGSVGQPGLLKGYWPSHSLSPQRR